jgi:5-methylcytosine-specific restriction endonuclease McrA
MRKFTRSPWNGSIGDGMPQVKRARKALNPGERKIVRAKTAGRCHVCGGLLGKGWTADHVLAHCRGGSGVVDNYLPACATCNRMRWHYPAGRFRKILALGVYMAKEIREGTELGKLARAKFNHRKRQSRLHRR